MLRLRPEEKRDVSYIVTGYYSEGKTTLNGALMLLLDDYFDLETQVFWNESSRQVIDVIEGLEPREIECMQKKRGIAYDEGENQFSNANPVMGLENRQLRQEYSVNREDGNYHGICLDDLKGINKYMRDRRLLYWFHIIERGKAILIRKDTSNPVKANSWHLKHFEETMNQITGGKSPTRKQVLKVFSKMPNVWKGGIIKFPELPPEFERRLSELKAQRKRKNLNDNSVNKNTKSYQADKYKTYIDDLFMIIRKNNISLKSIKQRKVIPEGTATRYYVEAGRKIKEEISNTISHNTHLIINKQAVSNDVEE